MMASGPAAKRPPHIAFAAGAGGDWGGLVICCPLEG
jgi:hypothetical protein